MRKSLREGIVREEIAGVGGKCFMVRLVCRLASQGISSLDRLFEVARSPMECVS